MHRPRRALLRLFFRLLYNEFAWAYDLVSWAVSLAEWQAWVRTSVAHLAGERVLELAHGPGHLLVAMATRGLQPVGLDQSPAMGRLARRRLKQARLMIPLVRARAQALPFPDAQFDSVVSTFPTEFIAEQSTLCEVARILRPGGRLVVVMWARLSERGLISRFLIWLYRVTGQAGPVAGTEVVLAATEDLKVSRVWEEVGSTKVMLFIADKQTRASN